MTAARRALLAVAFVATILFDAADPTAGNWKLPAVVALVSLGAYFLLPYWIEERRRREAERRRQMATYREDWFASFDRRRRMRGAR